MLARDLGGHRRGILIDLLNKRAVLITGKGGVGRSTISAGVAIAAARAGRRVLLVEIGEPESGYSPLARLFGRDRLPEKIEPIGRGVRGVLLWTRNGHEAFLKTVIPMPALVGAAVRSKALGRLLEAAPSFQEMGIFYLLLTLLKARRPEGGLENELLVFDMPATGHTLALTGLPDILLKLMPTGPIAEALKEGQSYIYNPALTATCVVTLPETLPVTECLELIEGLRATSMPVACAIVNKLAPQEFTEAEHEAVAPIVQAHKVFGADRFLRLSQTRRSLDRLRGAVDVPILTIPEFPEIGDDLLDAVSGAFLPLSPTGAP